MNPDVFITIAFAGIAALVPLAFLVFAVPRIRRENAGVDGATNPLARIDLPGTLRTTAQEREGARDGRTLSPDEQPR